MIKNTLVVISIIFLYLFGFVMFGYSISATELEDRLLKRASDELGIPIPDVTAPTYPTVIYVSREQVEYIVCRNTCESLAAQWGNLIYISDEVDINTTIGQGVLYHEMIHALQFSQYGVAPNCLEWTRREVVAYNLQFTWLEEQGIHEPWLKEIQPQLLAKCRAIRKKQKE